MNYVALLSAVTALVTSVTGLIAVLRHVTGTAHVQAPAPEPPNTTP